MKPRRNPSDTSSKPRDRRTLDKSLCAADDWYDGGAEFLRAVTSGSRVPDDHVIFDDLHTFRMDF